MNNNNSKIVIRKFFIITNLLWIIITNTSLTQWISQDSQTSVNLKSIYFINSNEGWACGDSNTVIKTTNGGDDWISISPEGNSNFYSIRFVNPNVGWIAGGTDFYYGGIIIKTTDGGTNWNTQVSNFPNWITSLDFISEYIGWASSSGVILKTNNGGNNWISLTNLESFPFNSLSFIDTVNGWAAGNFLTGSGVIKTIDGGNNWTTQFTYLGYELNSVNFIDKHNGWIAGWGGHPYDPGILLKTTNGGDVWTIDSIEYSRHLNSVIFTNKMSGYIAGSRGDFFESAAAIFFSSDGGTSWSVQYEDSTSVNALNSIYMMDENIGWAAGSNGMILKTTNGGITFTEENDQNNFIDEFNVDQNYPNPFNAATKIKYQTLNAGLVSLQVYNLLGEVVATLVNEEKPAGNYEVAFDGTGLTSGIYFYKFQAGSFVGTKKMLLMK